MRESMENKQLLRSPLGRAMEAFHMAGHSYVDVELLLSRSGMEMEFAAMELDALVAEGLLRVEGNRVCAERVHQAEVRAAKALALRLDDNQLPWQWNLTRTPKGYSQEQRDAVYMGLTHNLSLILGGAGTGKTTIISSLVEEFLEHRTGNFLLLAPTGRAAANIQDATYFKAATIHSALLCPSKWDGIQLLVVDEASMVTVELLDEILAKCPLSCRIVLVGDPGQLPAVGPGNVLWDLLSSGFPSITLVKNYRQKGSETALWYNVRKYWGLQNASNLQFDDSFRFVDAYDCNTAECVIEEALKEFRNGEAPQILTTVNSAGAASVDALNRALHPQVNPYHENAPFLPNHSDCFWDGDRVLVTQNMRDVGCCNGDICILRLYPHERSDAVAALKLRNGNTVYLCNQDQMKFLKHGYAMTVHKAQGSAFDTVIIPMTWAMRHTQNRSLLYTALSRARKKVILVGSRKALDYALQTRVPTRNSSLTERTLGRKPA